MTGYQHDGLQCEIITLEVDFRRKEAWLRLAEGNFCDMAGCTSLIESICPDIDRIYTKSWTNPATAYFKTDGKWIALAYNNGRYEAVG